MPALRGVWGLGVVSWGLLLREVEAEAVVGELDVGGEGGVGLGVVEVVGHVGEACGAGV